MHSLMFHITTLKKEVIAAFASWTVVNINSMNSVLSFCVFEDCFLMILYCTSCNLWEEGHLTNTICILATSKGFLLMKVELLVHFSYHSVLGRPLANLSKCANDSCYAYSNLKISNVFKHTWRKMEVFCDVNRVWRVWICVWKDRDWDKDQPWGWGEQGKVHATESVRHSNQDAVQWCSCVRLH